MRFLCTFVVKMDKKDFFNVLRSVYDQTQNLNQCFMILNEHLFKILPPTLYRYRRVSKDSIEAFENDKFITIVATKFNDPYDTLVAYNPDEIKTYLYKSISDELLTELKSMAQSTNGSCILGQFSDGLKELKDKYEQQVLKCRNKRELADCILNVILSERFKAEVIAPLKDVLKNFATIGCLCERRDSILMWSHYTDSHKGFLLEYDTTDLLVTAANNNAFLLPVDYSQFRYNATELVLANVLRLLGINMPDWNTFEVLMAMVKKSDEWAYENEWRVIRFPKRHVEKHNEVGIFTCKPKAIYYGANISNDDRANLHSIATRKKIPEFEMFLNETNSRFGMDYKSV